MAELFSRAAVNFGGAFHSELGIVTAQPGSGLTGLLMQNLQLQYSQQVTRIYELGTAGAKINVYYITGRSQGQVTVGHIIGPGATLALFYSTYSDVCNAPTNNLVLDLGQNVCLGTVAINVGVKYTCNFCVLTQIGMSVQAQDFVINENSQLMFSGLDFVG